MTTAKITGLTVQDFKRVRLVEIRPTENGLTIIGGRNAQGKSSVLDAIAYALGGEAFRPSDINRHDAGGNARIRVEIDGLVVERAGKNGALKITDARGMRGNQTLLNEIVSRFALDLGSFMRANEAEKAKLLLKMFPDLEAGLDALKREADEVRAARADVNRDIRRMQAQFDGMPKFDDAPDAEVDVHDLQAALRAADDAMRAANGERGELERMEASAAAEDGKAEQDNALAAARYDDLANHDIRALARHRELEEAVAEAQRRLREFDESAPEARRAVEQSITAALESASAHRDEAKRIRDEAAARRPEVDARIAECSERLEKAMVALDGAAELNEKARRNRARANLNEEIRHLDGESARMTETLAGIEARRLGMLQGADLPLPELSINEGGELLYRAQKWDCMSGSERLRVATAICMRAKPGCGFVLIDGLEALDGETLEDFGRFLEEQEMQGIGTIVGSNAATVVIEDGVVAGADADETKTEEKA